MSKNMQTKTENPINEVVNSPTSGQLFKEVEALSLLNKGVIKREMVRQLVVAKRLEFEHMLGLYKDELLIRKKVELHSLAAKANQFVKQLQAEHQVLMRELVVKVDEDVMQLLIEFGEMASKKIGLAEKAKMIPQIKQTVLKQILDRWQNTSNEIAVGLESFIENLRFEDREEDKEYLYAQAD